ncbi:OmpA family protein [Candidatus Fermentibacteria bacterium]|nr:OmpA family protein [Candidatus Fermentibacteria bacterium]
MRWVSLTVLAFLVASNAVSAGVSPGGLRGLIETLDAGNDGTGTLTLGFHGLYRSQKLTLLNEQERYHQGQFRLSVTYALATYVEFGAFVPYHMTYLSGRGDVDSDANDFESGFGDLETRAKLTIPFGPNEAIRLGGMGFYRFTTGDEDKGYGSDDPVMGGMGLLTFDLADIPGTAPIRLHANAGVEKYKDVEPADGLPSIEDNDILRLSAAVEFPTPAMSFFLEWSTDQLFEQGDLGFSDSPMRLTPGVRFGGQGESYLDIGVRIGLNGDDALYKAPDWELVVSLGTPSLMATRDRDGDGVADEHDLCPDTPSGAIVDANGCPTDSDLDGVYDGLDRCPGTPRGAIVDIWGCPTDSDGDGVPDGMDKCPDSPPGALVDRTGCPQDSDGDGVPDGMDRCPDTPRGARVDEFGCSEDSDGDGVPDGIDKCPETPPNAPVDRSGCPLDSDGDGVPDGIDKCPETRPNTVVDERGCPIDEDSDGVPDGVDRCPGTPYGVKVDGFGCPLDSDGDGVYDGLDRCPDTPYGVKVAANGCPLDEDKDGVPDGLDLCPDTPYGAVVDRNGCPLDSDGDGVYDGLDKCPNTTPGVKVNKWGCPERTRLEGVTFAYNSAELNPEALPVLDKAGQLLVDIPEMKVRIEGHTDSDGSDAYNLDLSQRRAESVRAYLTKRFSIDPMRIDARGFGESVPIASNATPEGKALNRRVEFVTVD